MADFFHKNSDLSTVIDRDSLQVLFIWIFSQNNRGAIFENKFIVL